MKKTTEDFIVNAIRVHGNKYDYSEVDYITSQTKVFIKCKKCGHLFAQTPNNHLKGAGCPMCKKEIVRTKEALSTKEFIKRAKKIHGDFFDYSKTNYINRHTKVCITCPTHGDFWQRPADHLRGCKCPQCWNENKKGHINTKNRGLVCGIGILDVDYAHTSNGKTQKGYLSWHGMLRRCYENGGLKGYEDCSVCDEWLRFSNFKKWFDNNYVEGYQLDKDILVKGNKVYSPETCCFVPPRINVLFTQRKKKANNLPTGVYYDKNKRKYGVSVLKKNIRTFMRFDSVKDAFRFYKKEKESYIKQEAKEYFRKGLIQENVYNAMMAYIVE